MKSILKRGVKNVSYLFVGNVISAVILFVGMIFFARILGPETYGIYVAAGAFVGLFEFLCFNGLNRVLLRDNCQNLSKMRSNLENTIGLKNTFSVIAIVVTISVAFLVPSYSLKMKLFIVLLTSNLFFNSTRGFFYTVYQAKERMNYIAYLNILNRSIFVFFSIIALLLGFEIIGLILVNILTNLFTLLINYFSVRRFLNFKFWKGIKWDSVIVKQALVFSLLAVILYISTKIDIVMISFLSTSTDVGIYSVSFNIVQQGEIIRNLVSLAIFPIVVKNFVKGSVKFSDLMKFSIVFFIIIIIGAAVVSIFSTDLITIVFGNDYKESGEILGVLIFSLAAGFAALPFWNILIASHREKLTLLTASIQAGLNVPLNIILFNMFGLVGIAYSTMFVSTAHLLVIFIISLRTMKKDKIISAN